MTLKSMLKHRAICTFFLLFALVFVRYLYYGATYFYSLDDYIQYYNYAHSSQGFFALVQKLGLLAARPLAGVFDVLVWSKFFPIMIVAVGILSALYAASGCILKFIFQRYFGCSHLFLVLFALMPLGFEGTYWVSASSRIIMGLFFAVLGVFCFLSYCITGKRAMLIFFMVFQLVCFGFYEQGIVFSITLTLLIAMLELKKSKRALWGLFTFANCGIFVLILSFFKSSALYGTRTALMLPNTDYYFTTFLPEILYQIKTAFVDGSFFITAKGFLRGLAFIWQDKAVFYVLCILALCCVLFVASVREKAKHARPWLGLLIGFLLFLAPITPFLILDNPWFSLRGTVMSFCGIALFGDIVVTALFKKIPQGQLIKGGLIALTALVFCVSSVSELHDYKLTHEEDIRAGVAVLEGLQSHPLFPSSVGVIGLEATFLPDQNFFYHEHLHGTTQSDWAFTGMLRYLSKDSTIPMVTPLSVANFMYAPYSKEGRQTEDFEKLYFYDQPSGTILPLSWKKTGEDAYTLFFEDGALCGYVYEENGTGLIEVVG